MQNNLSKEETQKKAFVFFKTIQFKENELTQESKDFIKLEFEKNDLEAYFSFETWWEGTEQILNKPYDYIVLFEYIIEKHSKQLSESVKNELYNLLLDVFIITEAFQKALLLIGFIEKTFVSSFFDE